MARYIDTLVKDLGWAKRFTANAASYRRLAFDFILYRVTKLISVPGMGKDRQIKLKNGVTLNYRLDRGDIWAIHEIWVEEVYQLNDETPRPVLVDLGTNIGMASVWLAKHYGTTYVVGVEPSESNVRMAKRNLVDNGIQGEIIHGAIGGEDGFLLFDECRSSTNGVALPDNKTTHAQQTRVPMLSMETVFSHLPDKARINLMKMDVEGAEGFLFAEPTPWLGRVDALVGEFHTMRVDYPTIQSRIETGGLKHCWATEPNPDVIAFYKCS